MQSRISSCFQLDSQYIGLIRPLCSNGITRFHRCRVNQPLLAFIPTDPGVRSYRTGLF
jgi:hypothetical protein